MYVEGEKYAEGCTVTVDAGSGNLGACDELWLRSWEREGGAGEGQEDGGLEKHGGVGGGMGSWTLV